MDRFTQDDLERALQKLSEEDREKVKKQQQRLLLEIPFRGKYHGRIPFGKTMALELLAKLGIYLNKKK